MILPVHTIIILALGVICYGVFLFFYARSAQYDSFFSTISEEDYPLKEVYSVGYAFMETIGYKYKSAYDRRLRNKIQIYYDKKYTEFYLRVIYAQKVTYTMLMIVIAFVVYALTRELMFFILCLGVAAFCFYYYGESISRKIDARSEKMSGEFAEVISKLAILTNAGLMLRESWNLVGSTSEGEIYDEMRRTTNDMKNGMSEAEALRQFGVRCMLPEIKKFSSTIVQSIERGSGDLTIILMDQSKELWEARKQNAIQAGEKASSKLMLPIFLMFLGILIMVIVPIFANLGV